MSVCLRLRHQLEFSLGVYIKYNMVSALIKVHRTQQQICIINSLIHYMLDIPLCSSECQHHFFQVET